MADGTLKWVDLKLKWAILASGNDKLLITKTLAREDTPVFTGFKVWDCENGDLLWSSAEGKFHSLHRHVVYYLQDQQTFSISFPEAVVKATTLPFNTSKIWYFPQSYTADSPWFEAFTQFIKAKTGNTPIWQCDYLEYENGIFVMYYICVGQNFEQHLTVFDESGAVVLQLTLAKALKARTLQTFFIGQNRLICVQDNDKILTYNTK